MAKTKYGKYVISYDPAKGKEVPLGPTIARLDDSIAKGCYFYFVHWVLPNTSPPSKIGHPPHIHKDAELLFHIGTNPDDPMDLGAEVEIFLGPELERHVFTKSTVIYIPPNFIHCPWKPIKTERPWIFVEVNQGPVHTEKLYPQLLPKEVRDSMDWTVWKNLESGFD
jgi:hypothetical protein